MGTGSATGSRADGHGRRAPNLAALLAVNYKQARAPHARTGPRRALRWRALTRPLLFAAGFVGVLLFVLRRAHLL